jgi:hypothetical protein
MLATEQNQETATEDAKGSNVMDVLASITKEEIGIRIEEDDCVAVPVKRYEELVRAKTELDVVVRLTKGVDSYNLRSSLIVALGLEPKGKSDE